MHRFRLSGFVLIASLLSGCASWTAQSNVDALNSATATGPAFATALTSEYKAMANEEYAEADYENADFFARKGLLSSTGALVLPAESNMFYIPEPAQPEISNAESRLKSALEAGIREKAPSTAAKAQASFDCWLEEQEENHQPADIAACRDTFEANMKELGFGVESKYIVFFDFDDAKLTKAASAIVKQAAQDSKSNGVATFKVTAHTDTSGTTAYNMKLSKARAQAVKSALIAQGIKASNIVTDAKGEAIPLEPTADGIKNANNRRAEISFR